MEHGQVSPRIWPGQANQLYLGFREHRNKSKVNRRMEQEQRNRRASGSTTNAFEAYSM